MISKFPRAVQVNYLMQRYFTVGRELPDAFVTDRLRHARNHLGAWKKHGTKTLHEVRVFENGTGWYPLVPLVFFLAGAQHIVTTDVHPHCSAASLRQAIRALLRLHEQQRLQEFIPGDYAGRLLLLREALEAPSLEAMLQILRIRYRVCETAAWLEADEKFDLVISNNTIQFVPAEKLDLFFDTLQHISTAQTVWSHFIDLSDEFAHSDPSIGPLHFLQYSDEEWKSITSWLNAPSRVRYPHYREQLASLNRTVCEEQLTVADQRVLQQQIIHPQFAAYAPADLLVTHFRFVALDA